MTPVSELISGNAFLDSGDSVAHKVVIKNIDA